MLPESGRGGRGGKSPPMSSTAESSVDANPLMWIWKVLTSYGLVVIILLLMTVVTLFGTLEQTERGLFDVQKAYFESLGRDR